MQPDLSRFTTEAVNPDTRDIDRVSTLDMVRQLNREDKKVALAVETQLPAIAHAVDAIAAAMANGGRLIYTGAGTSGRLGILDASECPPTYGVSAETVMGLIAGGHDAIFKAKENVEDSRTDGEADLRAIGLKPVDVVCAIAASGRTPYCLGGMAYAKSLGCTVLAITCNPDADMVREADIAIVPVVGPEAVSGSTRMKAGTAQKMVLNMLSTGSMIRMGKTFGNLMVDVQATNEKLRVRSENIVMQATGVDRDTAKQHLAAAGGRVKLAVLTALTGLDAEEGQKQLEAVHGRLRDIPGIQEK